jgi:hypothetical protein
MSGEYVVVRTHYAGVHVGELVSQTGQEVCLINCRRIWHWEGANTLHEIATFGVKTGSRVSCVAAKIILQGCLETITCSPEGEKVLRAAGWAE